MIIEQRPLDYIAQGMFIRAGHPLEKLHQLFGDDVKFICIFKLFKQLTTSVRCCLYRAHTSYLSHLG